MKKLSKTSVFLLIISGLIFLYLKAQPSKGVSVGEKIYQTKLLYKDNFDEKKDMWVVEQMPGGKTSWMNGKLDIRDKSGCTVWFKKKLKAPVIIEYNVTMIDSGAVNERSSDLNCFWMAIDPDNPDNLFKNSEERGGNFSNYHPLRCYYVGYGANWNTTTRFRRYPGDGSRPLLPEHDLKKKKYMNMPNQKRKVQIVSKKEQLLYVVDGEVVFDIIDKKPYTEGWFGFRTVKNHMKIDNFRVYRIK